MTYENLDGRTAVVTGAASGMGAAIATLLASSGARVALVSRRADRLAELAEKITANGGRALSVPVDITDADAVAAAASTIRSELGRVDLVVNNAGVMLPNPITDGRADEWQRMIDTNLTGALRVAHAFVADLVDAVADGGMADLVNISSIGANVVFPNYAVYGATKAALSHFSANLRAELGPKDVRVTNLEPGLTDTELGSHLDNPELSAQLDGMFATIPALTSEDVADLVGYVTSRPGKVNLANVVLVPTRQA